MMATLSYSFTSPSTMYGSLHVRSLIEERPKQGPDMVHCQGDISGRAEASRWLSRWSACLCEHSSLGRCRHYGRPEHH